MLQKCQFLLQLTGFGVDFIPESTIQNCLQTTFSKNKVFNSFPASGDFCHLLITFADSLDPDQARLNVGLNMDPNCLTLMVFLKDFFVKVNFENKITEDKKACRITQHAKI